MRVCSVHRCVVYASRRHTDLQLRDIHVRPRILIAPNMECTNTVSGCFETSYVPRRERPGDPLLDVHVQSPTHGYAWAGVVLTLGTSECSTAARRIIATREEGTHARVDVISRRPRRNIVNILLSFLPHILRSPVQALIIHGCLQIYATRPSNHCISYGHKSITGV